MSRSPYGERGLKYTSSVLCNYQTKSLSLRRAWIEIKPFQDNIHTL